MARTLRHVVATEVAMSGKRPSKSGPVDVDLGGNLGGMFKSLGGFLELLSDLAEKGEALKRSGELGDEKKGVKAVYGFSVRVGGGGKPQIENFGNVGSDRDGSPVVEEAREPLVDVFDEKDHLLVVAELPGVSESEIRFEVKGDVLHLSAAHGDRKYQKELLLPATVSGQGATSSYRHGVLELKLPRAS
jgi:HSP20 family protein